MKICLITGYFHPEIASDTHLMLDLANDLAKYGANVTVVTPFPSKGLDKQTRQKYFGIPEEISSNGVVIIRVGLKSAEGKYFLFRAIRYIYLSYTIYKRAKTIRPDVYFVNSQPPFLGLAGAFLSKTAPTVYCLQDIFPDSLVFTKKSKENSLAIKLFRKAERLIYRKNTHISVISEDFKKNILAKGVPEEKISVVYNWIDVHAVIPIKRTENKLIKKYNLDPTAFYVTYCGNIGYSQNLEMVVDVAKRMEAIYPDLIFIFNGDGSWICEITKYIKIKNAGNVLILPYQPYEMISSVFSLGDVSLVCSKKGVSVGSVPSKTWGIMSAARAVLCSFDEDSELTSIIRKAECGICVPPEDGDEFEKAVTILYENRNITEQYGFNGREFIEKNLTREQSTLKHFDILKKLV